MTKILKMVCEWNPEAQNLIKKALEEDKFNLDRNSWWYLHGELESLCHYNKAVVLNLSEFPEYQGDTLKWTSIIGDVAEVNKFEENKEIKINDIIPVQVIGIDKPCIGYFWTTDERTVTAQCKNGRTREFQHWCQRGLVCLSEDIESCKEAKEKYLKKTSIL